MPFRKKEETIFPSKLMKRSISTVAPTPIMTNGKNECRNTLPD